MDFIIVPAWVIKAYNLRGEKLLVYCFFLQHSQFLKSKQIPKLPSLAESLDITLKELLGIIAELTEKGLLEGIQEGYRVKIKDTEPETTQIAIQKKKPDWDEKEIIAWWNKNSPFGQVLKLTPARKAALRSRIEIECEGSVERFKEVLQIAFRSDFLNGRNDNANSWKANFDFCVTQSKFIKIMEGAYDFKNGTQKQSQIDVMKQVHNQMFNQSPVDDQQYELIDFPE